MRVLVAVILGTGALLVVGGPAAADCSGPTVDWAPHEVARGGTVTVTGSAFGDNCYDTGPPPPGQGFLGVPRQDLQIVVVQGEVEVVVAEGDADAEYAFEVDIVVPPELQPGPANLVVRVPEGRVDPTAIDGLTITDEPPTGTAATVVDFSVEPGDDEAEGEAAGPGDDDGDDGDGLPVGWIVAGAFVVATAAGALLAARAR